MRGDWLFAAERAGSDWRTVSYGQAVAAADAIGQALAVTLDEGTHRGVAALPGVG